MKILLPLFILILSFSIFGQIKADNPADVIAFVESIKDFSVKRNDETNRQYNDRIKNFVLTTKFKDKPVAETVFVVQDVKYSGKYFSADFFNRKIDSITLYLKGLDNERGMLGARTPVFTPTPDKVKLIQDKIRLAVYGFPLAYDQKYQGLSFMPLKYVYFNGETGEIYAASHADNDFAAYVSKDIALPEIKIEAKPETKTIVKENRPEKVQYFGDTSAKLFYTPNCGEVDEIKSVHRVSFFSREEGENQGFKLSAKCSPPKLPAQQKSDLPPGEKPFRLGKTAKAINILAVLTYPENWVDRKIIIDGWVKLGNLPDPSEFGNRRLQGFWIRDKSKEIYVIADESPGTKQLRDAIIKNDGDWIEGTFTFILYSKVYTNGSRIGVLQSFKIY